MNLIIRRFGCPFIALLFFTFPAVATPKVAIETLEWATIDAELIVRANVISAEEDKSSRRGYFVWETVKLRVIETIKGPSFQEIVVAHLSTGPAESYTKKPGWRKPDAESLARNSEWTTPGAEILIFLDRREKFGQGAGLPQGSQWMVRRNGGAYNFWREQAMRLDATDDTYLNNMYAMYTFGGFTAREPILTGQLLQRTRRAAALATLVKQPKSTVIAWSEGAIWHEDSAATSGVIVPVCEPFLNDVRNRALLDKNPIACIWCLARAHTPENEEYVRKILEDSHESWKYTALSPLPWQELHYPSRAVAYEVLKGWRVSAERPIINAPADWHEPAAKTLIGIVLILLAWPVGWIFVRRPDGRRYSFAAMLGGFSFILSALIGLAWLSSYTWSWSLDWPNGNYGRWQLASYRGMIRLLSVDTEPTIRPTQLVGGIFHPTGWAQQTWNLSDTAPKKGWHHLGGSFGEVSPASTSSDYIWAGLTPWSWWLAASSVPLILCASAHANRLRARHKRRKRLKRGQCPSCGYDLRATPLKCPECGAFQIESA